MLQQKAAVKPFPGRGYSSREEGKGDLPVFGEQDKREGSAGLSLWITDTSPKDKP